MAVGDVSRNKNGALVTSPGKMSRDKVNCTASTQSDQPEVDQDYEVQCGDHEHFDIVVVDEVVPLSIDKVFECFFTDHALYRNFQELRKSTYLVQGDWSDVDEKGEKSRTVSYKVFITATVGPKSAHTTEKQVLRAESKPGLCYLIDSEASSSGPVYSDHFYCLNRFCINRHSANSTHFKITSKIVYVKKVWALLKGIIDRSIKNQTCESYVQLCQLFRNEADRLGITGDSTPSSPDVTAQRKRKQRTVKKQLSLDEVTQRKSEPVLNQNEGGLIFEKEPITNIVTSQQGAEIKKRPKTQRVTSRDLYHRSASKDAVGSQEQDKLVIQISIDVIVQVIFVLILILAGTNLMLYYKLNTVEQQARLATHSWTQFSSDDAQRNEQTKPNPDIYRDMDLMQWKEILSASATMMEQMQRHFVELTHELERGRQHRKKQIYEPENTNIRGTV